MNQDNKPNSQPGSSQSQAQGQGPSQQTAALRAAPAGNAGTAEGNGGDVCNSMGVKIMQLAKDTMGTVFFLGKFNGMRKAQDFIVYPLSNGTSTAAITIQSDTRIGYIDLRSGDVLLSPSITSGAYNPHLRLARKIDCLSHVELSNIKAAVMATTHAKAGTSTAKGCA